MDARAYNAGGGASPAGPEYDTYTVKAGDSEEVFPHEVGLAVSSSTAPGEDTLLDGVLPGLPDTYTVKAGDSLAAIGAKTGVDWKTIAALNGIGSPYTIYPGQVLKLAEKHAPGASVLGGEGLPGQGFDKHSSRRRAAPAVPDGAILPLYPVGLLGPPLPS